MSDKNNSHRRVSLLARIAWMYYIQELTQEEIAKKLDFSRTKVTRLLAQARDEGVVEINISRKFRTCFEIEEMLKETFSLETVRVVPQGVNTDDTREGVGVACAGYLEQNLADGDIIGCSWGRNLFHVGTALRSIKDLDLSVVQLSGGMNTGGELLPQKVMELMVSKLSAKGIWLNTPAVVAHLDIKKALIRDYSINEALSLGRNCDKALVGIGDFTDTASLVVTGSITREENAELKQAGAVGDILCRHYDINGKVVKSSIADRVMAITLEELGKIPLRIGVTSGKEKAQPILGAINGGYINALITDEETANELLKLSRHN
ncbi:MAG: sugar-binding transcriptional regulator [Spirochaetales bacterium]|nr:sugar-binding transcriptional regulator [Spirochaetales bacterium]